MRKLRKLYAALALWLGIALSAIFIIVLILLMLTWGFYAAFYLNSDYWNQFIRGYDKLGNAGLDGDHREYVSSRLGKYKYHGHEPVFLKAWIDDLIIWWLHQLERFHSKKAIQKNVGEPVN